jgi:predicted ribosome quality control (RQC) complex YloA/Tae2 family protein
MIAVIIMSMDGRFIQKLAGEMNRDLGGGRINKLYQLSKTDFLFVVHKDGESRQLYLSLSLQFARMHISWHVYDKPASPSGFCMLLRKYLEGGILQEIRSLHDDRIIQVTIENHNDFGVIVNYYLIVELMGKYANLTLTEPDYVIIDCFKHVSPFDGQQRTFQKGVTYEVPVDGKIAPSETDAVATFLNTKEELTGKILVDGIRGLSPLFASYYLSQLTGNPVSRTDLFRVLSDHEIQPTVSVIEDKTRFYYFDVFSRGVKKSYPSLSKLMDEVFFDSGQLERTKQVSKYIYQLIKREFEKNKEKLEKLTSELNEAKNADILRIYGDMIRQYQEQVHKGDDGLSAFSYELNKDVRIPLDRLLTPNQNVMAYFKKYKKNRQAILHLEQQITLTLHEIAYFDLLLSQIETASLNDLLEITEELKANKYLSAKTVRNTNKHPNYDTYLDSESNEIVVGKNNIQNEYITHQMGKANEWWFHTKEIPGSHVLVRQVGDLSEATIRAAANLAAWHSKAKMSSSVPVDYTKIKNVKKIPGVPGSFVTYTQQKTIYIDPSKEFVDQLTKKK